MENQDTPLIPPVPQPAQTAASIQIGLAFSTGLEAFKKNFLNLTLTVLVACVVGGIAAYIPLIGPVTGLLVGGFLMLGLFGAALKAVDGGTVEVGDLFKYTSHWWRAALALFLMQVSSMIPVGLCMGVGAWLAFKGGMGVLATIGFGIIGWFVGMAIVALFVFWAPLVADKGIHEWQALQISLQLARQHFFPLVALVIMAMILSVAGAMLCLIGLFPAAGLAVVTLASAYRQLCPRAEVMADTTQTSADRPLIVAGAIALGAVIIIGLGIFFTVGVAVMKNFKGLQGMKFEAQQQNEAAEAPVPKKQTQPQPATKSSSLPAAPTDIPEETPPAVSPQEKPSVSSESGEWKEKVEFPGWVKVPAGLKFRNHQKMTMSGITAGTAEFKSAMAPDALGESFKLSWKGAGIEVQEIVSEGEEKTRTLVALSASRGQTITVVIQSKEGGSSGTIAYQQTPTSTTDAPEQKPETPASDTPPAAE